MLKLTQVGVVVALLSCVAVPSAAEEPAAPKVTVEFRWIEPEIVKGLTEDKGHPVVCGGKDWYAHLKPVLTSKDIATAKLTQLNLGNGDQYGVEFTLSNDALKKLVEACGEEPSRVLTVYVNGRWYGASDFYKSKPDKFTAPMAGFMLSKSHAEQILKASQ